MSFVQKGVVFAVIFCSVVLSGLYWHIHSLVQIDNQLSQYFQVYPNQYRYFFQLVSHGRWRDRVTVTFQIAEDRQLLESGLGFVYLSSTFHEDNGEYFIDFFFDHELLASFVDDPRLLELAVNEQFMHRAWNEVVQNDTEVERYFQVIPL